MKDLTGDLGASTYFLSTARRREKTWGINLPQVFCCKSAACLAQNGNSLSRLLPLFIELFGMLVVRWSSREMPCARQAVVVKCGEVIS